MTVRHLEEANLCEIDGCDKKATEIAYDAVAGVVRFCCSDHREKVIEQDHPEYWDECPNCGCHKGVN